MYKKKPTLVAKKMPCILSFHLLPCETYCSMNLKAIISTILYKKENKTIMLKKSSKILKHLVNLGKWTSNMI